MKSGLKCITIIHPVDWINNYREVAAFFRLLGIFVCEKLEGMTFDRESDAVIQLIGENKEISLMSLLNQEVFLDFFDTDTISILKKIAVIFLRNDLMRGSYAIEYFSDSKCSEIYQDMLRSYDCFFTALNEFETLEGSISNTELLSFKYVLASEANCMRRMSQLYSILWEAVEKQWIDDRKITKKNLLERKFYPIDEIDNKLQMILEIDPQYFGAYAIKALAEIVDDDMKIDSIADFRKAVLMIGDKSYTSYLRFRMGRYYQYILKKPDKSRMQFEKAYEMDSNNYRAVFKLAMIELDNKNDEKALEYLQKIIDILDCKKNTKVLQPIECAYLFKAYKFRGKIYLKNDQYDVCLREMKEAEKVYKNQANEDENGGFYKFMFKNRKMIYKNAARNKLEIWKLYELMAEASAKAGYYEEYNVYRNQ